MIRNVNLIGYLPPYVQDYREIQAIMNAEEPELQQVEDDSEIIKNNMFVLHTNEDGVKRYEKMFGITPPTNESLYNRQMTVLAQYTNTVIYTLRGLIDRLNIICGVGNYTLELNADKYELNIGFRLRVKNLISTVNAILVDMIPANMLCSCNILYNTHEILSKYPTYLLMQFTHQELREEEIEDNISVSCDNITNYTMESFEEVPCEQFFNFGMRKV